MTSGSANETNDFFSGQTKEQTMAENTNNSGCCNSGDYNSGNRNSGDHNSGNRNSGDYNSGNRNSENCNSGNRNSGNCNSGNCNSGNFNSGNFNSGDRNSGDYNSGNYNSGNYNSGFFCTATPNPTFFDQPSSLSWDNIDIPFVCLPVCCSWVAAESMTDDEKSMYPNHETIGGYLKSSPMPLNEAFPIGWAKLSEEDRQKFLDLPNFDADKFYQITGVDVRSVEKTQEACNTIELNGVRYKLVPIED